ncbi:hypothetical protein L208DRAFT_1174562, partial [Tricholoma matsutake]
PDTSNYDLDLPSELQSRRVHGRFHVNLLHPYFPSDDTLFPNRRCLDPYDFGVPDDMEWWVEEIMAHRWKAHRWKGRALELEVKWSVGESTWEPLAVCNELVALDAYLALVGAKDWNELPKHAPACKRR